MTVPINIRTSGIRESLQWLDRKEERISNFAPFWRSVTPILKSEVANVFAQEGPNWRPLSPYTIAVRRFPGYPILYQTGALERSLTVDPFVVYGRSEFQFGTTNPYASDHEFGTDRIPARPFLRPAYENSKDRIRAEAIRYITEQLASRN